VGSWRVVSLQGSGSYGVVYLVEKVGQADAGPFALKLAKHPLDPRFEREGELLSRIHHPCVPRLEARGWLTFPGGVPFPYLVMEWVEGMPLYAWAAQQERTSRQVLRLLAQVARALEATHAAEGVHRDVKGDNVRVRAEDGSAVLIDFGSGYFRGAPILTRQPPPPGTGKYWSPECLRFQWKWLRHPTMRYEAGPADDLYALGVMAYRLVTGVYPPPGVDFVETEEGTQLVQPAPVPVETRVTVCPELAALITQLLSDEPSARGSTAEVAEAFERAANIAGPRADQPITALSAQAPGASTPRAAPPRHELRGLQWLAVGVSVLLGFGVGWMAHKLTGLEPAGVAGSGRGASKQDADVVGLGDEVPAAPVSETSSKPERSGMALDMPKKPLPGQHRPPCRKPAVEINGGCWVLLEEAPPPCGARSIEWNKGCYVPLLELAQPPTSGRPWGCGERSCPE
jgi:predicted Ser/Thr protein kinase